MGRSMVGDMDGESAGEPGAVAPREGAPGAAATKGAPHSGQNFAPGAHEC